MGKILSIIIPSYNCEKFLDKCVSSMLCEEVLDKLDIIIVNDGSIDSTESIGLKYAEKYPSSIRVISQENKGHGGALNTGLSNAIGKYSKVIDADDWVETDNLPLFIEKLTEIDSDVVLTHHYTTDISTNEVKKWKSYPQSFGKAYNFKTIMSKWNDFSRSLTFHGITYNTKFYKKYCIQLSEHVFYEDHEYATHPCCYAKSITPLDIFIYNYRIGDVAQSVSDENQLKRISHTKTVIERLVSEYKNLRLPQKCKGRTYYAMKTQGILLSYLSTVLLVEKDKKQGRVQAKLMVEFILENMPQAFKLAKKQYNTFMLMNYLHIGKKTFSKMLESKLYNKIKGKRDFK